MASLAEKIIDDAEDPIVQADDQPEARPEELRLLEALLFASSEPLDQAALAKRMPDGVDIKSALARLQADYAMRGVNLIRVANKWTFRTAGDLSWLMTRETTETRKLSRAAVEVLAIVAYHQPVTRAEIEDIRGVVTSKGTLDVLLETGWIRPRGRRKTPGRPLTFGTTDTFLSQFSLEALGDLPGLEELKGTGLLDSRLPAGFSVPNPSDDPTLREDEDPLEDGELGLSLPEPEPEFPGLIEKAVDALELEIAERQLVDPETVEAEAGDVVGFAEVEEIVEIEVVEAELEVGDDLAELAEDADESEEADAGLETAKPELGDADTIEAEIDAAETAEIEAEAPESAELEADGLEETEAVDPAPRLGEAGSDEPEEDTER
ncbi:SMC-Scp complex subunit ScpB [Tardiphaga sp. vice352]|uniref:SMC-Scp complex subunit ScpB n=1 Tax=Tardiphaga sp. vice352 TaxID=2592816 RepID=UPI0011634D02|nr:SMC-Scp complex subunit ScpB [Tardiphaga sp. vice352]QDM32809.1 SMC-Scp complex subunit ScpB [Tardiphaga sp. vice352]